MNASRRRYDAAVSTGEERAAFITLATATEDGPVHMRVWEIPLGEEAVARFAATLSEAYGEPSEFITDDSVDPDRPRVVIYGGPG